MVTDNRNDTLVFWGCFIALITTAFGFITRMFLIDTWGVEFGLNDPEKGRLAGIGIWPFALSIIGFSLFIDRIGYKKAAYFAFFGHITWAVMGVSAFFVDKATGYQLLYWGSLILALGNGAVEAFINPVVATMFSKEKTKWLNILHAGWPGGLVIAGIIVIAIGGMDWWIKVGIIALPSLVYIAMLIPRTFPVSERVESGVSYREMLAEFGILGALAVGFLVTLQLMDFASAGGARLLPTAEKLAYVGIGLAIVVAFGAYTRSLGRPLMFILVLIMMPLATTEIGTDGWITDIMKPVATQSGFDPGWVLVYTSAIMVVLRFFAGPIVHALSPLGLLCISAVLAIAGLATLSFTAGLMIFGAATLYGIGKTFFWPTMLGVVAEQTPKGGALTLNAISGIGMLAVGTLGFPFIGTLKPTKQIQAVAQSEDAKNVPGLIKDGELTVLKEKKIYEILAYDEINNDQLNLRISELVIGKLPKPDQDDFNSAVATLRNDLPNPDDPKKPINEQTQLRIRVAGIPLAARKDVNELLKTLSAADQASVVRITAAIQEPKTAKEIDSLIAKLPELQQSALKDLAKQRADLNSLLLKLSASDRAAVTHVILAVEKDQGSIQGKIQDTRDGANQQALLTMAFFPVIMLIGYIGLIFYFKSRGGYNVQAIEEAGKDKDSGNDN